MSDYIILFWVFFKTGLFSFGGGTAMLPLIYQSVSAFGIMGAEGFSDMVALSQVTPGPVAVNAATYAGFIFKGIPGSIVATIGVCLPCFVVMLAAVKFLDRFKDNKLVSGAFEGIRPVTVGLVASATVFIADGVLVHGPLVSKALFSLGYYDWIAVGIFVASIFLMGVMKVKPIMVMLVMAVAGALIYGLL